MKKILINDTLWQKRIAITRQNLLQNIYFDTLTSNNLERCYFKGTVTRVLPGIQTAFVDIGQERAGFLHISEIDRELAIKRLGHADSDHDQDNVDEIDETTSAYSAESLSQPISIDKIFKEGETILVQVIKEPINEKGAKLSTCFTLPGRFIVLMPNIPRIGISKKIEEREERQRLKELLLSNLPQGMGAIIRTTSEGQPAEDILQDLKYLVQTWHQIYERYQKAQPGQKIYEDIEMGLQIVRDHLDKDVEAIICDNKQTQQTVYKFVKNSAPEYANIVKLYEGDMPLFKYFDIESQIEAALNKKVSLDSGGSIIIESTEAMTVIDVNSGRYTGKTSLEETILKINLEAAQEIVRQLRLRNIGGLIVIDFIDMAIHQNRQRLFKFLEKTLKERDKFQSVVLRVSEFGLVQMTRKRSGKTLAQQLMRSCAECHGLGMVKSLETESYAILRHLEEELRAKRLQGLITLSVHIQVFNYLISHQYNALLALEKEFNSKITLATTAEHSEHKTFTIE